MQILHSTLRPDLEVGLKPTFKSSGILVHAQISELLRWRAVAFV